MTTPSDHPPSIPGLPPELPWPVSGKRGPGRPPGRAQGHATDDAPQPAKHRRRGRKPAATAQQQAGNSGQAGHKRRRGRPLGPVLSDVERRAQQAAYQRSWRARHPAPSRTAGEGRGGRSPDSSAMAPGGVRNIEAPLSNSADFSEMPGVGSGGSCGNRGIRGFRDAQEGERGDEAGGRMVGGVIGDCGARDVDLGMLIERLEPEAREMWERMEGDDGLRDEFIERVREAGARRFLLEFMKYCWRTPLLPMVEGRHTVEIARRLDRAVIDLGEGRSTYLIIIVPIRHGKSDLVSRYFPPWILGINPNLEIILSTYGADLSEELSRDARGILDSEEYRRLFPGVVLDSGSASVASWRIAGRRGKLLAVGLEGGAPGRGSDVLLGDDLLKGRAEAESERYRDSTYDLFIDNLMSRLAPVHLVVICTTRWHVDDVVGRIMVAMEDRNRPNFPKFEVMHYRARETVVGADGVTSYKYLFPERFPVEWYERQFGVRGIYEAAAILQGEPFIKGGNRIMVDRVQYAEAMPEGLLWVRFWDLASTEKERGKDSPDFTWGTRLAVKVIGNAGDVGVPMLYIDDCRFVQAEAPERNRLIVRTALEDGGGVWQAVEGIAGYKDAGATLAEILKGVSIVHRVENLAGDKGVRAGLLEPIFEAGNVVLKRAWWNEALLKDLREFPRGKHDDGTDSISGGYPIARERWEVARKFGGSVGRGAELWGRKGGVA